jgi:hypothetical protein
MQNLLGHLAALGVSRDVVHTEAFVCRPQRPDPPGAGTRDRAGRATGPVHQQHPGGTIDEERALREYETRYGREFGVFYEFLISFYEMNRDEQSYFWQAKKVTNNSRTEMQSFVELVLRQARAIVVAHGGSPKPAVQGAASAVVGARREARMAG